MAVNVMRCRIAFYVMQAVWILEAGGTADNRIIRPGIFRMRI